MNKVATGFPKIDDICNKYDDAEGALTLFQNRGVSAEKLSLACKRIGDDISASTIRTYRRTLPEERTA